MPFPASVRIHPTAEVEVGADVGPHTVIWRFAHVMAGASLGSHCSLGQGCFVGRGVQIGSHCRIQNNVSLYEGVVLQSHVFVGPSVVFTNVKRPRAHTATPPSQYLPTHVAAGASIGANATIVCGVRIGAGAMVGAGAVVTRDVPDHALVMGCPARVRGGVCACGGDLRAEPAPRCTACNATYRYDAKNGWAPLQTLPPL